jgi:hypothetical protein
MGAWGNVEFTWQLPQMIASYLSVLAKLKALGLLGCFQLLNFLSSTLMMAIATASTDLGGTSQEFPTAQLKDEPVFKGGGVSWA